MLLQINQTYDENDSV